MKIKQYDTVVLKDGREGDVMEIYGDYEVFLVTVGDDEYTWEDIDVKLDDIVEVI
nr:hypothetical protein [uncultured Peptostreptococcus sp.]